MTAPLSFYPNHDIVQAFDLTTRERLVDSLNYLAEVSSEHIELSANELEQANVRIRQQSILPETLAAYYELVGAIQSGDFDEARALFQEVLNAEPASDTLKVIPYLGADDIPSIRYIRQVDTDPDNPFNIHPSSQEDFARAKQLIEESLELLQSENPALFAEITTLLKRIMLGSGPKEKGQFTFDGASAPGLWGAIVLNAVEPVDVVDMAQTLAHESCHNLLFGYCIDDQLVNNPDSERHASPLRIDPRPLDGIYHATFVLARMHYTAATLADSPRVSAELQQKACQEMKAREVGFYDGLATLKKHADYTDQGKALMDAAEAYMNKATGKQVS
ncbi:hypothetical protein JO972_08235 [Verrucomicrobiaceae bacterium 5K15]|uniref:HEXXH motif domain-containing protein n=1 Tax=Oceaniferula flava TaxID=2800421 RepID=A0AAE2SBX6_9BACT|nr:HEXXH motif-containing putative peptide modification protein [Oceaniferula flavus]MBK1854944.1 hypothetical protein [Oceaniferula flavus]MBM1136250.1 hypothetical protein [Oceaniferula flavus]